jgi:hypothetical protein
MKQIWAIIGVRGVAFSRGVKIGTFDTFDTFVTE